jgi:iron complex outermembrane receptor protein
MRLAPPESHHPKDAARSGKFPGKIGYSAPRQNDACGVDAAKINREGKTLAARLRPSTRHMLLLGALTLPILPAGRVCAQTAPASSPGATEEITVVGTTPLLGSGIDRDKVPANAQVLDSKELSPEGTPDLLHALDTDVPGVSLASGAGNPYQPDLFLNGFEASPLQGTSQGVAVYMNGVRFNQPFGDTVNFDLIPTLAIDKLNIEGSNPVFGLNALGGSVNIQLKNGFTAPGAEFDISGGSFGQIQANLQYGKQWGDVAFYIAGTEEHQDGWRDLQSTDIETLYSDLGVRHDQGELHLSLNLANSVLNGPGTAPVELLAVDSAAQFTAPNAIANHFLQTALSGTWHLSDVLSVQGNAYYSYFQQRVVNGNSPNDVPCDDGTGLLCQDIDDTSTTRGGGAIPAFLGDKPESYNELDTQTTNTNGYGVSAQVTDTGTVFGFTNHAVAGASFDGAQTEFSATAYIGGVTDVSRIFIGPGTVIDEPGNNVPVRVAISDGYYAGFASDTLDLTEKLSLTLSGRFNTAEVNLSDQNGGDLTGNHAYSRFNPAAGITYRFAPWLNLYAGYSEANRAPTPAELSCAGPNDSCSLANFFVGDPDLKQVIAHTWEAGLRGHTQFIPGQTLSYDVGLYHTDSDDDIIFVNSVTLGRAFFANVGQTRREGVNARLAYKTDLWSAHATYSYTQATFQTGYVESGGSNPAQDANGNLTIRPGDRLPGVPANKLNFGADVTPLAGLSLGVDGVWQGGQYLFGDEANLTPKLPPFFTMNLHGSYQLTTSLQLFANVQNVTDARYYTFGTFSPTNAVYLAQTPNATNPRSYSLQAPIAWYGGVRLTF